MKKISLYVLLLSIYANVVAQINQTDENIFREGVKILASDEFGGRKPMTPYETLTTDYIVEKFKEIGLQPGNKDSFIQDVPLLNVNTSLRNNRIEVKGKNGTINLIDYQDLILWSPRAEKNIKLKNTDFVFVGFGINAPEYNWNDYEGIDVRDKIVVALVNDPGFYDDTLFRGKDMTYYGRWIYKFEEASRQGAKGILVIHEEAPASYGWNVVQASWGGVNLNLFSKNKNEELVALQGWISLSGVKKIFDVTDLNFETIISEAKKKNLAINLNARANTEIINDFSLGISANVVGILPGTDLKDEYIIYTAHWDHFGFGKPIDGDSIYNGASDNATGVAALFVLANRFVQQEIPPRRTIVFLSVTAEEAVLLGSEYYCRHPLFPISKTVININLDGYGPKGRTKDVILLAKGDSETDRYVYDAAASQGRNVKPIENKRGSYFRSDHFSFAKVGIPVTLVSGGTEYIDTEEEKIVKSRNGGKSTYHQPTDEYSDDWIVSGSLEDIYLIYGIGYRLSQENVFPQWTTK